MICVEAIVSAPESATMEFKIQNRKDPNHKRSDRSLLLSCEIFARHEDFPDRGLSGRSPCGVLKRAGICLRRFACQRAAPNMGAVLVPDRGPSGRSARVEGPSPRVFRRVSRRSEPLRPEWARSLRFPLRRPEFVRLVRSFILF